MSALHLVTDFTSRLRNIVETVPGAVGAIFADWEGEAIDQAGRSRDEMLLLGAHYGIILRYVQSALRTFHFGDAKEVIILHERIHLLMHAVGDRYYVVLAVDQSGHLGRALAQIRELAASLAREIA